jgi:hypothetical protein
MGWQSAHFDCRGAVVSALRTSYNDNQEMLSRTEKGDRRDHDAQ